MTDPALLRLLQILSPSFPLGAFSYSHGLEWAVEDGLVTDRPGLESWIDASLRWGPARMDCAFAAMGWAGQPSFDDLVDLAVTYRGSTEIALESEAQGAALWRIVCDVWPDAMADLAQQLKPSHPVIASPGEGQAKQFSDGRASSLDCRVEPKVSPRNDRGQDWSIDRPISLAPLLGAVGHRLGIGQADLVRGFAHAFAANIVSAGVRLIPLGQTDGQRALVHLEPVIEEAAQWGLSAGIDELGSCAAIIDWASMRHETQYTRLFRS